MERTYLALCLVLLCLGSASAQCGFLGLFCGSSGGNQQSCPPPGFDSVRDFDIDRYISAPWFVQEQTPLRYQPIEELFCVRARYEFVDPADRSKGLIVYNYANEGGVNGNPRGTNGVGGDSSPFGQLRALVPDPSDPSKLEVGPELFQRALGPQLAQTIYGPYWVVALDPNYEWAIISGGPPNLKTDNGCIPGRQFLSSLNGRGLWLFSRKPVDPENTALMRQKAEELGYDLSFLANVEQEGCTYEGAI